MIPAILLSGIRKKHELTWLGNTGKLNKRGHTATGLYCCMNGSFQRFPGGLVMIKIAPSILSADFVNLERDIRHVSDCGADYIHVDVMDGLFVPNITIGLPVLSAIRRITDTPLDVHLMIDRPIRYVERFLEAGADLLTLHIESDTLENTPQALKLIRDRGAKASVSLKPATPAEEVIPLLPYCDMILIMTVEPGFGGQSFMADMMPKLEKIRSWCIRDQLECDLEVDGGVSEKTALPCIQAGANVLVAGNALFRAPDIAAFIQTLKALEASV